MARRSLSGGKVGVGITWQDLRNTVGLPKGTASWGVFFTVLTLTLAGWLLQDRMNAPDRSELDYSELCRFVDEGKVSRVLIEGQSVVAELNAAPAVVSHGRATFRSTMPSNDPNFFLLLRERKVGVRVVAVRHGMMTRIFLAVLPLASFLCLGLWFSRRPRGTSVDDDTKQSTECVQ